MTDHPDATGVDTLADQVHFDRAGAAFGHHPVVVRGAGGVRIPVEGDDGTRAGGQGGDYPIQLGVLAFEKLVRSGIEVDRDAGRGHGSRWGRRRLPNGFRSGFGGCRVIGGKAQMRRGGRSGLLRCAAREAVADLLVDPGRGVELGYPDRPGADPDLRLTGPQAHHLDRNRRLVRAFGREGRLQFVSDRAGDGDLQRGQRVAARRDRLAVISGVGFELHPLVVGHRTPREGAHPDHQGGASAQREDPDQQSADPGRSHQAITVDT